MKLLLLLTSAWLIIDIIKFISSITRGRKVRIYDFSLENTLPLRGVLALLIALHHVSQRIVSTPILSEFSQWGEYIVALFFFIMGYGLTISYEKKGTSYLDGFFKRRIIKLILPYIICIIGYTSYLWLKVPKYNIITSLKNSGVDFSDVLLPTSWYVIAALAFYLMFYTVMRFTKKLSIGIPCLLVYLYGYFHVMRHFEFGRCWFATIYAIGVGMVYAYFEGKIRMAFSKMPLLYTSCLLFLFLILYILIPHYANSLSIDYRYDVMKASVFPIFIISAIYATGFFRNRVLCFLGSISYEIYLVQGALTWNYAFLSESSILYSYTVISMSIMLAYMLHVLCRYIYKYCKI